MRLGPFIGGLNTGSDQTAIADAELVTCTNLELDIDGSLVSRPPLKELDGHSLFTERIVVLCEAVFTGNHYLIGSNSNGVFHFFNGVWTLITNTFRSACAVQYADQVYLVPHPSAANPGGKWSPGGGFVAVAAIPKGQALAVHKERLFIVPGKAASINVSRVTFTDPSNFDVWPAANFIDVGQGDGTALLDVTVYQDNLLLFKDQSSFILAFDIRPTDAVMKRISSTIGVDGQFCVLNYENQVYTLHNGWVYEIINYDFQRLNTKVPFVLDSTAPSAFSLENVSLSLVGDRLVVRYYARTYVYGLRTRTWCEWLSSRGRVHYFGPAVTIHEDAGDKFYAGSSITGYTSLTQIFNKSDVITFEETLDPPSTITDTFTRTVANGWGTLDTGEIWTQNGGAPADYSVNGTRGRIDHPSVNATRLMAKSGTHTAPDIRLTVLPSAVSTGAAIACDIWAQFATTSNSYLCRLAFDLGGVATLFLYKLVAGAATLFTSVGLGGTYVASEQYTVRLQINGSSLKAKAWKTANNEPTGWTISVTDATFTSGQVVVGSFIPTGNTNVSPSMQFDNVFIGDMANTKFDIQCDARTKNFDMAVSSQFKRLWWWGADVITNRDVLGIASPIVATFAVTWAQLEAFTWASREAFTWAQPMATSPGVPTTVVTNTGTSRRFVKFNKSLRYRQINFFIRLLTDGSTGQGPARLFVLQITTAPKEGVSKALS